MPVVNIFFWLMLVFVAIVAALLIWEHIQAERQAQKQLRQLTRRRQIRTAVRATSAEALPLRPVTIAYRFQTIPSSSEKTTAELAWDWTGPSQRAGDPKQKMSSRQHLSA